MPKTNEKTNEERLDQFLRKCKPTKPAGKALSKRLPAKLFDALCEGFDDLNTMATMADPEDDELSGFGKVARDCAMPLDDLLAEVLKRTVPGVSANQIAMLAIEIDSYGGEGLDMLKEVVFQGKDQKGLRKLERVFVELGC